MVDHPITEVSFLRSGFLPWLQHRVTSILRPQPKSHAADLAQAMRLTRQLRDFVNGSRSLFWTRQGMYFGSSLLAAYYYDPTVALFCFSFCQLTEALDNMVSARVMNWGGGSLVRARQFHQSLLLTSTLSSIAVALFTLLVASFEAPGAHFTPIFFLFAAGLFAAVNNHQLPSVLLVRLIIYGAVFLYIPVVELIQFTPPLESHLWLQFATVVFVLFFVIQCSIIFLKLYRDGLDQMDELRLERDKARAALETKSQFVSVVSHELRTPLHSIMGSLSLLSSGALSTAPEREAKVLNIAHRNSQRLSKLINDLLDLQKLESGQMDYEFGSNCMKTLVEEAIESLNPLAESSEVRIELSAPNAEILAHVDHSKFLQVLCNLLSNAIKFSPKGAAVEVSVSQSVGAAVVRVSDHGIGIPPNSRDKVFGKFSQIDSADDRNYEGSGLGLSIAEQIVTAHQGTIDYVSEMKKGTTFTVTVPLA